MAPKKLTWENEEASALCGAGAFAKWALMSWNSPKILGRPAIDGSHEGIMNSLPSQWNDRCSGIPQGRCSNLILAWGTDSTLPRIRKNMKNESEVAQLCPTLWDPMDCSLPGSSVHRFSQARILEQDAISYSRGSFQPRIEPTCLVSLALAGGFFTTEPLYHH